MDKVITKVLAYLIESRAPVSEIKASRAALDMELATAQELLSSGSAPAAVVTNAAVIVFREGLEAVLILASLMGSLKQGENRKYRRPLWGGVAVAMLATVLTWLLAHGILAALARFGERLEAIVSLIAIGVLLLITNWFFHKVYWTGWIANFHHRKRQLLSGEASYGWAWPHWVSPVSTAKALKRCCFCKHWCWKEAWRWCWAA